MARGLMSALIPPLLAGFAALHAAGAAEQSQAKVAVPSAAAQRTSRQRLDEAFPVEGGKVATPAAKADRARMLLAAATPDLGPADRYVLLDTARGLAAEAGDVDGAMSCLAALAREFSLPADAEAAKTLQAVAPKTDATQVPRLIEESIDLAARIRAEGDVDGAEELLRTVMAAAKRVNARSHMEMAATALAAQRQSDRTLSKERALEARLADSPDDEAVAMELAVIKCLTREDWVTGLRMLQRAGDERAAALAKQDLAVGNEPANMLRMADAWWDFAGQSKGDLAKVATTRAVSHYTAVWDSLKGLDRPRVQRRIEEANARLAKKTGAKAAPRPSGLLLHVDASEQTALVAGDGRPVGSRKGVAVARWLDAGNIGFSPVQGDATRMPVSAIHEPSGQRAVRFSGQAFLGSPVPMPKDGVCIVVCQPDQPLVTGCPVGLQDQKSGIEICTRADGMALFRIFPSRGEREQINTSAGALSKLSTVVITVCWTTPMVLRVNGAPLNVWNESRRPDISDSPGIVIGSRTSTCDETFAGLICECFLFRGQLDDAAISRIERDLAVKWKAQR
jgi:hypothetical protein